MLMPLALALSNKALMISVLFLVFLSFRVPFSVDTLVAGFSMGYLFFIVSPTPSGIGGVEGVLTLSLNTLGVPIDAAAVVALAYRGFTFWVPFFLRDGVFPDTGETRRTLNRGINRRMNLIDSLTPEQGIILARLKIVSGKSNEPRKRAFCRPMTGQTK